MERFFILRVQLCLVKHFFYLIKEGLVALGGLGCKLLIVLHFFKSFLMLRRNYLGSPNIYMNQEIASAIAFQAG